MRGDLTRETLELIVANRLSWPAAVEQERVVIVGSGEAFESFLVSFDGWSEGWGAGGSAR